MAGKIAEQFVPGDRLYLNIPAQRAVRGGTGLNPTQYEFEVNDRGVIQCVAPQGIRQVLNVPGANAAGGRPPRFDLNAYLALTAANGPEETRRAEEMHKAHLAELEAFRNQQRQVGGFGTFGDRIKRAAFVFLGEVAGLKEGQQNGENWGLQPDTMVVRIPARPDNAPDTPGVFTLQPTPVWGGITVRLITVKLAA